MSYREAVEDSIRKVIVGTQSVYYPPCQFCGGDVKSYNYLRSYRYTCKHCRPIKNILLKTGLFTAKIKDESKCD